jgi:hypothetical protein
MPRRRAGGMTRQATERCTDAGAPPMKTTARVRGRSWSTIRGCPTREVTLAASAQASYGVCGPRVDQTEYAETGACAGPGKGARRPRDCSDGFGSGSGRRSGGDGRRRVPLVSGARRWFSPDAGPVSPGRRSSNARPSISDKRSEWDHATRRSNSCIKSSYSLAADSS